MRYDLWICQILAEVMYGYRQTLHVWLLLRMELAEGRNSIPWWTDWTLKTSCINSTKAGSTPAWENSPNTWMPVCRITGDMVLKQSSFQVYSREVGCWLLCGTCIANYCVWYWAWVLTTTYILLYICSALDVKYGPGKLVIELSGPEVN